MNLDKIYLFAKNILEQDTTAHDWKHALRVEKNARTISPTTLSENELNIIKVSCWLHDTIDPKISTSHQIELDELEEVLKAADATSDEINQIFYIIQNLSYSKNIEKKRELDLLGQIVQDADRLDAIGAIGIARAFYYGGSNGHELYSDAPPRSLDEITEANYRAQTSVVNHFYEKLLFLEQSMNTPKGKNIAHIRTARMKDFLEQLSDEVGFK